jgi:hypothetical protein
VVGRSVIGCIVLAAATIGLAIPAQAAEPSITVTSQVTGKQIPPNGTDSTFADVLNIQAQLAQSSDTGSLSIQNPTGQVCTASSLSYQLDTRSADGCTGSKGQPVANGTWVLKVKDTSCSITGTCSESDASVDIGLATPPAPPQNVSTSYQSGAITLGWQPNTEPDLTGYTVYQRDPSGGDAFLLSVGPSCSVSCSARYAESTPGSYTFVVRADRANAPRPTATIASSDSAPVTATVPDSTSSSNPSGGPSSSASSPAPKSSSTSGSSVGSPAGSTANPGRYTWPGQGGTAGASAPSQPQAKPGAPLFARSAPPAGMRHVVSNPLFAFGHLAFPGLPPLNLGPLHGIAGGDPLGANPLLASGQPSPSSVNTTRSASVQNAAARRSAGGAGATGLGVALLAVIAVLIAVGVTRARARRWLVPATEPATGTLWFTRDAASAPAKAVSAADEHSADTVAAGIGNQA